MFRKVVTIVILSILCYQHSTFLYSAGGEQEQPSKEKQEQHLKEESKEKHMAVGFYSGITTKVLYVDSVIERALLDKIINPLTDDTYNKLLELIVACYTNICDRYELCIPDFTEDTSSEIRIKKLVEHIYISSTSRINYAHLKGHICIDITKFEATKIMPTLMKDEIFQHIISKISKCCPHISSRVFSFDSPTLKSYFEDDIYKYSKKEWEKSHTNFINKAFDNVIEYMKLKKRHEITDKMKDTLIFLFEDLLCAGYIDSIIAKKELKYLKYLDCLVHMVAIDFYDKTNDLKVSDRSEDYTYYDLMHYIYNEMMHDNSPENHTSHIQDRCNQSSPDKLLQYINKYRRKFGQSYTKIKLKEVDNEFIKKQKVNGVDIKQKSQEAKLIFDYITIAPPGIYILVVNKNDNKLIILKETSEKARLFSTNIGEFTFSCTNTLGANVLLAQIAINTLSSYSKLYKCTVDSSHIHKRPVNDDPNNSVHSEEISFSTKNLIEDSVEIIKCLCQQQFSDYEVSRDDKKKEVTIKIPSRHYESTISYGNMRRYQDGFRIFMVIKNEDQIDDVEYICNPRPIESEILTEYGHKMSEFMESSEDNLPENNAH